MDGQTNQKLQRPRRTAWNKLVTLLAILITLGSSYIFQDKITALVFILAKKNPSASTAPTITEPSSAEANEQRDLKRYRDAELLRIALNSYRGDKNEYPDRLDQLVPRFLTTVPSDPTTGATYPYAKTSVGYRLTITFEAGVLSLAAGEHQMTPRGYDIPDELTAPTVTPTEPTETPPDVELPVEDATPEDDATDAVSSGNDTDADGLNDVEESTIFSTDPNDTDTDGDGFGDGDEVWAGYDPTRPDANLVDGDGDGLADALETARGTDPSNYDTDGDGISDGDEMRIYGTSPTVADTDNDGFGDGAEIAAGYEPLGPGPLSNIRLDDIERRAAKYGRTSPPASP